MNCLKCGQPTTEAKCPACGFALSGRMVSLGRLNAAKINRTLNNGHHRRTYPGGDWGGVYEGDFVNGKRHGKGTFHFNVGVVYTGDWRNDKRTGFGMQFGTRGDYYAGDFVDGKWHGRGTYRWPIGNVYTGEFRESKMHGNGVQHGTSGDTYIGQFDHGRWGKGVLTLPDGRVFRVEYANGKEISRTLLK